MEKYAWIELRNNVNLVHEHLGITDVVVSDFASCHQQWDNNTF